jgi:hypothetical protein
VHLLFGQVSFLPTAPSHELWSVALCLDCSGRKADMCAPEEVKRRLLAASQAVLVCDEALLQHQAKGRFPGDVALGAPFVLSMCECESVSVSVSVSVSA